jgi:ketosteroid isomerase-like protein
MSEENVDIVRRVTGLAEEGIRRGDPGAPWDDCVAQGLITPNLEWRAGSRGGTGVAGLNDVVGREGYVEFAGRWTEDFDNYEAEYERFIEAGDDRVLVLVRSSGTGKASGAPVELHTAMLFELEEECVVRVVIFLNQEDAFKAAGIQE